MALRLDLLDHLVRHSDKAMRTTAFGVADDIDESPLGRTETVKVMDDLTPAASSNPGYNS
jgi:hypothetical protein